MKKLVASLLVLTSAFVAACSGVSAAERKAVDEYTKKAAELAKEGGRIVVQEIRPSLREIESGELKPEQFRTFAKGWKSGMENVRRGFAEARTTEHLKPVAKLFDEAFRLYIAAIDLFAAASLKTGQELKDAITAAIPTAERADKTYDRAAAALRKERKRVGLPPVSVP
jgi:hypothetical protein